MRSIPKNQSPGAAVQMKYAANGSYTSSILQTLSICTPPTLSSLPTNQVSASKIFTVRGTKSAVNSKTCAKRTTELVSGTCEV